jgi:hypothetical protein
LAPFAVFAGINRRLATILTAASLDHRARHDTIQSATAAEETGFVSVLQGSYPVAIQKPKKEESQANSA